MKAVTYNKARDLFSVSAIDMPVLQSAHDVVVRVKAVGLNPVDAKINLWHPMVPDMADDFVPGLDVAGEIVAVGEAVTSWKKGDHVVYHGNMRRPSGGFAEYAVHDSRTLLPLGDVDPVIAAATPCAGWTAWRALVDRLKIAHRGSLFIAGGAGGVGGFSLQIARHFNLPIIATSCSARNMAYVASLGATHAFDYSKAGFKSELAALMEGQGFEVALDCVGGDEDILCANLLAFEGEMVELVQLVRPEAYEDAFLRGLVFHQLSLGSGHVNGAAGRAGIVSAGEGFHALLQAGEINVPALEKLALEDIPDALVGMREQRTVGKLVAVL